MIVPNQSVLLRGDGSSSVLRGLDVEKHCNLVCAAALLMSFTYILGQFAGPWSIRTTAGNVYSSSLSAPPRGYVPADISRTAPLSSAKRGLKFSLAASSRMGTSSYHLSENLDQQQFSVSFSSWALSAETLLSISCFLPGASFLFQRKMLTAAHVPVKQLETPGQGM